MNENNIYQSNKESTERLCKLVNSLSENDLSKLIGTDWTISITLAHLAFWDQRAIYVIESANKNKKLHAPYYDDQLNDILTPILKSIPAVVAAKMAVTIADKLDKDIENCPIELLEEIKKVNSRLLERSIHRNTHLDEIENTMRNK